jgi:hypothetical protein
LVEKEGKLKKELKKDKKKDSVEWGEKISEI